MPTHSGRSDGSVTAKARVKGTTPRPSCISAPAPRLCPGRYLAILEMKTARATLARNFSVEYAEVSAITQEVFAFAMMPSRLRMRLDAID
jgi:Cytochrome P450